MAIQQEQQSKGSKFAQLVGKISFIIAIAFLVVYLITVITSSGTFFVDSAQRSAMLKLQDDYEKTQQLAQYHYNNLYDIADQIQGAQTSDQVQNVLKGYIGSDLYGDLRYFSQGKGYSADGVWVQHETSAHDMIHALASGNTPGCTEVYHDVVTSKECIAFFIPVRGSAYVDGLLSIIEARNLVNLTTVLNKDSSAVALVDKTGKVLASKSKSDFTTPIGSNFYEFVDQIASDSKAVAEVGLAIRGTQKTACMVNSFGDDYVFAVTPVEAFSNNLILVSVSASQGLIAPEMVFIRHIVNLIVIAILSLVIGFMYAFFYYRQSKRAIAVATYTDPVVGCANAEQFRSVAGKHISDRIRHYAVATLNVRQFRYISEHNSETETSEMLQFIAKVLETFCDPRETFGYIGDGKFAMLISYSSDRSLKEKFNLIESVVKKYPMFANDKGKKFDIGVCLAFGERHLSIQEVMHRANVACDNSKANINEQYVVYTQQVSAEREHNDRIEAEMEGALANNEFRLFLQPKYNIAGDKIDSAEALVRWFDPRTGDYRFPGEFISLFESNGFITKLDHFIYLETLKYLSSAAEKGEKVVPISVNVSLVTVSDDSFLDFYIDNKRKYRIADNFITIEFTESFAMVDYARIQQIVDQLHKNGIRCSLDDFGTGYASFNVLKNIELDELKLDRMFLAPGANKQHDDSLMETVITLAKSLNMSVVQEGVETKEIFDRVVEKGVDVIQGYYYAKAVPVEEFRLFVGTNTSIKYKSLVK